jgi:hypothetical protein
MPSQTIKQGKSIEMLKWGDKFGFVLKNCNFALSIYLYSLPRLAHPIRALLFDC